MKKYFRKLTKASFKKFFIAFFLAITAGFFVANYVQAATITVPTNYSTIQAAVNTASAGDTIIVNSGTYNEYVTVNHSGSSGAPITIQAGGAVTMRGFNVVGSYVNIEGFNILDAADTGVRVEGNNCHVKNNIITRVYNQGIQVNGNYNVVDGNDISHVKSYSSSEYDDADGIWFFGSGNVLRNNYIHDMYESEATGAHMDCFMSFGNSWYSASNTIIEGNVCLNGTGKTNLVHQCLIMSALDSGGAPPDGLIFRNNVCDNYGWQGLMLDRGSIPNAEIYNNTFLNTVLSRAIELGDTATNAKIYNNIFYLNNQTVPYLGAGLPSASLIDYNLWNGGTLDEAHGLSNADPQFVNFAGKDFHLKPGSPACGRGLNGTDIGAYPCDGGGGSCTPNWSCTAWSVCSGGQQTRTCSDSNNCGTTSGRPALTQSCTVSASCGDGTCNGTESCSSCSGDCGQCPAQTVKYNLTNFTNLVTDWLKSLTGSPADVNLDNKVNSRDLGIMMSNWEASAPGTNNITIRAKGVIGDETIDLRVNDNTIKTWTLTTSYQDYSTSANISSSDEVRVYFTNDVGDRDVQIDYLKIDNTTYQAENQTTNTGGWNYDTAACGGAQSEWLHCNGYIQFQGESSPPPPQETCGNGNCAGGETCSTCPGDCGQCSSPPPPSGGADIITESHWNSISNNWSCVNRTGGGLFPTDHHQIDCSTSAPGSSSCSIKYIYPQGWPYGGEPYHCWNIFPSQPEFWAQWYFKYSSGYTWNPIAQKQVYFKTDGNIAGKNSRNFFIGPNGSRKMWGNNQSVESAAWTSNTGYNPTINDNQWYKVTLHYKNNTIGQSNGLLELWLDGQKVWSYSLAVIGSGDTGISSMEITPVYGGMGGVDKPKEEYQWYDHTIVSTSPLL